MNENISSQIRRIVWLSDLSASARALTCFVGICAWKWQDFILLVAAIITGLATCWLMLALHNALGTLSSEMIRVETEARFRAKRNAP